MDDNEKLRKKLHLTVYTQCFSPCGKYLATGDNFGNLSIFGVSQFLAPEAPSQSRQPIFTFHAHKGCVFTLITTDTFLISGGTDCIKAWSWTALVAKNPKVQWSFEVNVQDRLSGYGPTEINSLALDTHNDNVHLLAGCGDNLVHRWDIQSGQELASLSGHTNYIHCVTVKNTSHQCVTGSEDGTVRIFDLRTPKQAVHLIEPFKNEQCNRPKKGKWIGCVALDKADDWMVCGGGPQLCLWHLRSLAATTVFDAGQCETKAAMFHEDTIISAGSEPFVRHWSVNGEQRSKVPCSPTFVYNVAINNTDSNKVLTVAGNSYKIDVCTNFGYKAFSLEVC